MTTSDRGRRATFLSRPARVFFIGLAFVVAAARAEAGLHVIGIPVDGNGGTPPGNMEGGGDLVTIFNQAAAYWEAAFPDPDQDWTLTLTYKWGTDGANEVGGLSAALFRLDTVGGDPNRMLSGRVFFDNSGTTEFFADPNPGSNAEYSTVTPLGGDVSAPNAPGGVAWVNNGINYTDPKSDPMRKRTDLLTIAMHEIGHGLGLAIDPPKWTVPAQCFPISEDVSHFYAEFELCTDSQGEHMNLTSVIPVYGQLGVRAFPTAQDIMAMAELSQFRRPVLDPYFEMIVGDLAIPHGHKASLLAKLRNARRLAQAGNRTAARNLFEVFIRQVAANPDGRLSPEQVEGLVGMAEAAIGEL